MSASSAALNPRDMAKQLYALNRLLIKALVQCELACERDNELTEQSTRASNDAPQER
jgi:hypothetical protein